jgi:hypothetical protein
MQVSPPARLRCLSWGLLQILAVFIRIKTIKTTPKLSVTRATVFLHTAQQVLLLKHSGLERIGVLLYFLVKKNGLFENKKLTYQSHLEKYQNKLPKTRWAK